MNIMHANLLVIASRPNGQKSDSNLWAKFLEGFKCNAAKAFPYTATQFKEIPFKEFQRHQIQRASASRKSSEYCYYLVRIKRRLYVSSCLSSGIDRLMHNAKVRGNLSGRNFSSRSSDSECRNLAREGRTNERKRKNLNFYSHILFE